MAEKLTEIVIPKEKAVFRMDARGRWHNAQGRFRKKSIIDHFNRSIGRDADGYFVTQINGERIEKVYFAYEDTALFVTDVVFTDISAAGAPSATAVRLILNTGKELPLRPAALFIQNDNLYLETAGERIRFDERSLMTLSEILEGDDTACFLRLADARYPIRQKEPSAMS